MKKLTITLIVFLFVTNGIFAQTGTIKGFVKDKKTGEPIWNVHVYVETGGNIIGNPTDFDGKYTIKPLNSGKYTVITKIQGYASIVTQNVDVTSDKITYVNVDMEQTAELLPPVYVIDYVVPLISKDEPHVKTLTADVIKNDPNIHNPVQMLNQIEGVTAAENGDVYVRGSRPQSTQFITDGMKSISGDIGIPGQAIGSIKVYTGGVPARYGDLTGGVIVVETKSYYDFIQD
jgi:carboxypeptidase family protein/TonB-dependent receptor-like protein